MSMLVISHRHYGLSPSFVNLHGSHFTALRVFAQVAEAEAAFLKSLHQVAQLSAQMQQLVSAVVPKDTAAWQVTKETRALRKDAAGLAATHKQQKQVTILRSASQVKHFGCYDACCW
jgi:hypothetical protein